MLKKTVLFVPFLVCFMISALSQDIRDTPPKAVFDFADYEFTIENLYPGIPQSKITGVHLAYRAVTDSDPRNLPLFEPGESDSGYINLEDLLDWAAREHDLPMYAYDARDPFKKRISREEVSRQTDLGSWSNVDSVLQQRTGQYLLLESTLYGHNNQVLERRVIGLMPVNSVIARMDVGIVDTMDVVTCWYYFPDIMHLLEAHRFPGDAEYGSTLDFFTEGHYRGENITTELLLNYLPFEMNTEEEAMSPRDVEGNWKWIISRLEKGVFGDPWNTMYQGTPEKKVKRPKGPGPGAGRSLDRGVVYARYVDHIIGISHAGNAPLFVPVDPTLGQTNLIHTLLEGIRQNRYQAFEPGREDLFARRLTVEEVETRLGAEKMMVKTMDNRDTLVTYPFKPSEIRGYLLREVIFYDRNGQSIRSEYVLLSPLRKYYREYEGRPVTEKTFNLSLRDAGLRGYLPGRFITQFAPGEPVSCLSFLEDDRYHDTIHHSGFATVAYAARLSDLRYETPEREPPVYPEARDLEKNRQVSLEWIRIAPDQAADRWQRYRERIESFREQDPLSDIEALDPPANFPLYYPGWQENGFTNLSDLLISAAGKGKARGYRTMENGSFSGRLTTDETRESIRDREGDAYLFVQLRTGGEVWPVAIAPLGLEPGMEPDHDPGEDAVCWIPFNRHLRSLLVRQVLFDIGTESPGTSYYTFFKNEQFRGTPVREESLSSEQASALLQRLR